MLRSSLHAALYAGLLGASCFSEVVDAHLAVGAEAGDPLVRDGSTRSLRLAVIGGAELGGAVLGGFDVVKHDVEGHALGAGLKAQGTLERTILGDMFKLDSLGWDASGEAPR